MKGTVDSKGRALITVRIRATKSGEVSSLEAWVETGFTGELVFPQAMIASLKLPLGDRVRGVLADGSTVLLDTYRCFVDWFGKWKQVDVVANQGQLPLLGVGLLLGHRLQVDYVDNTLSLT